MGAFFCVCVLPFKTKFLKKRDEEMKMKMREREREREISLGGSFFKQQCFVAEQHKETKKKKNLSLSPKALSPNPKSTIIILQNLFFACVNIYRVVSTQYN